MKIAVDAMGGDHAPRSEVEGALAAVREYPVSVILVGQEDRIRAELKHQNFKNNLPVEIHNASQVITMEDMAAASFRRKRDSSVRVAARLVREGKADGVVSAGNTGAVMATSKIVMGVLPSVDRPVLAAVFPTSKGKPSILLDVGANVDCKPIHLKQFAIMGEIYSRVIFNVAHPRVGLLSIGEESSKGNDLTKEVYGLLKKSSLNFVGNVEGRDLYNGSCDVIVCDGFIGNVALKVSEGLVEAIRELLREELSATLRSKMGYVLSQRAFANFKRRLDYSEYGGAPLLGLKGVGIICHGRSSGHAIKNAIRVAYDFCHNKLSEKIELEISRIAPSLNLEETSSTPLDEETQMPRRAH
ncbi:MAG: phosphate acyltransferase PlsX [Acidobacteriia bacterium]|nr:phosphate acyltransferase PlsX [Terriglobia bacterium]